MTLVNFITEDEILQNENIMFSNNQNIVWGGKGKAKITLIKSLINLIVKRSALAGHAIKQTWPKCGPPTYFCGPRTFFCYVEKQHISSTNTNLVKNCTYFFSKGIKRTIFSCFTNIII